MTWRLEWLERLEPNMERIWKGYGKDMERIWKGYGKDMERIWKGCKCLKI